MLTFVMEMTDSFKAINNSGGTHAPVRSKGRRAEEALIFPPGKISTGNRQAWWKM